MDLAFLPATEQARLVRAREVSSGELVQLYLERIERIDPELNAFVTVCAEEALASARVADESAAQSPFHGVPVAVKDLTATAGIRTTYSCRGFAENVPDFDTAVVRRIRDAGFVLLGKTNTPEFGTVAFTESELNGATHNPWNAALTPGGSSGGAAAALAAGLVPLAHGSDGGGSIRIPASCCGVFGLKPSRGRVSSAPFSSLEGLSTSGPLTRSVADAAAFLDVLAGYEPGDPWWAPPPGRPFADEIGESPGRLRVAVTTSPPIDASVHPECVAATRSAATLLEELEHDVEDAAPSWDIPGLIDDFITVWQIGPTLYPVADELTDTAQSAARRQGARDLCRRVRSRGDPSSGGGAAHRRLLGAVRRTSHAHTRSASGADRVARGGRRGRARSAPPEYLVHTVHRGLEPHRPACDVPAPSHLE